MERPGATDSDLVDSTEVGRNASRQGARVAVLIPAGNAAFSGRPCGQSLLSLPIHIPAQGLTLGRRAPGRGSEGFPALTHPQASTRHATISEVDGSHTICDAGSTNGTFLNGRRMFAPSPLADGDCIFAGGEAFVYRIASQPELDAIDEEIAHPLGPVPSRNPRFARSLRRLRYLAEGDGELLLIGETGVGKEVYARAIHTHSKRAGAFVAINCAAIPSELVESELFGFVRGAHSQAKEAKAGLIAEADGGTLLLDEIGDMPPSAQAKLLRFVQTKELWPIGATRAQKVDVRVVGATSHLLPQSSAPGVRDELMARLGASPPLLPPLAARREDIGPLIAYLMANNAKPIEPSAFCALLTYAWPRNVRELKAVIEEALVFCQNEATLTLEHLPAFFSQAEPVSAVSSTPAVIEKVRRVPRPVPSQQELEQLLVRFHGNLAHVARHIDREWKVIKRAVDRYGIDLSRFRS